MSSNGDEINRREVAWRLFASEFRDADYSYAESDEERAPNYVVTPTGARVNRLFVVGVLTEVEYVSDDYLRARIVDPTGAFVVYAGQYQPEALTFLESAETPMFVAVTGKARTFQPEDSDIVYTSIRPESISEVDATTRDNWVVTTAEQTLERVATTADALDLVERGDDLRAVLAARHVPEGLAAGITLAIDHYGTTEHYLAAVRDLALDAARVVAGEREEVRQHTIDPSDESDEAVALGLDGLSLVTGDAQPVTTEPTEDAGAEEAPEASEVEADADAAAEAAVETESDTDHAESGEAETEPADVEGESADAEAESADAEAPTVGSGGTAEAEQEAESEPDTDAESDTEAEQAPAAEGNSTDDPEADANLEGEPADDSDAQPTAEQEPVDTDEMYELSEEERREVEENYDVGFTTADEVEGEAGIEPEAPQPGEAEAEEPETVEPEAEEPEPEPTTESTDEAESASTGAEAAEDADAADAGGAVSADDLEDAVVETMQDLGDGDGADRDDIVETVMDAHGVDEAAVADAIQAALMSGRCYESGENELTAI